MLFVSQQVLLSCPMFDSVPSTATFRFRDWQHREADGTHTPRILPRDSIWHFAKFSVHVIDI